MLFAVVASQPIFRGLATTQPGSGEWWVAVCGLAAKLVSGGNGGCCLVWPRSSQLAAKLVSRGVVVMVVVVVASLQMFNLG